jgi:hypothetical protein
MRTSSTNASVTTVPLGSRYGRTAARIARRASPRSQGGVPLTRIFVFALGRGG